MVAKGHKVKSMINYSRHITSFQHKLELGINLRGKRRRKKKEAECGGKEPHHIFISST